MDDQTPPPGTPQNLVAPGDEKWGWPEIIGCFLFAQIVAGIAFALYLAGNGLPSDTRPQDAAITASLVSSIPIWFGFGALPIIALRLRGSNAFEAFRISMRWSDVPLGLIIGVLCQVPGAFIVSYPFTVLFDVDPAALEERAQKLIDSAAGTSGTLQLVVMVVIMAPICEEVFFRGLIHRTLARSLGTWPTIVVGGAIFGATHLQLLEFPALAAFGMVLSYLVYRYGRLGPAIWAHIGFNATTVASLLLL